MRLLARLPVPDAPAGRTIVIALDARGDVQLTFMGRGLWADPSERITGLPPAALRDLAIAIGAAADAYELTT